MYIKATNVRGDIRDIGGHDFSALEDLSLPDTAHGGKFYEFQNVSDVDRVVLKIKTIRARLTGLIQSQAVTAVTTKLTLRSCSVLNGV